MGVLPGLAAMPAEGEPVAVPAGEVIGIGVIPIGAVVQKQATVNPKGW